MKNYVVAALVFALGSVGAAPPESLQQLAAQSALHVDVGLKKIDTAAPLEPERIRREVTRPAAELLKAWRASGITDAMRMTYSVCLGILGDLEGYGEEAIRPPRYHLGALAQQKLKFIREDLPACRKLAKAA